MSFHVYIANEGFKDAPISVDTWLAAVRQRKELRIVPVKNRRGRVIHNIALHGDKRARIALNLYGVVSAQDPPQALVQVMFELAEDLGAHVYSERLKPYASVDDWECRTRLYRKNRDVRRAALRSKRRLRMLMWCAAILGGAGVGWFVG